MVVVLDYFLCFVFCGCLILIGWFDSKQRA